MFVGSYCATADAGIVTYYNETFFDDNGEGASGATPPVVADDQGQWTIDATGATLQSGNDFARVNGTSFQFRDLSGASGPGPAGPGQAVFTTTLIPIQVGSVGNFTFLTMSIDAVVGGPAGNNMLVESLIDGMVVDSTLLTSTGTVTHNLLDDIMDNTTHNYQLRVTVNQNIVTTFSIDNILVQGNSTPEPASMSMLGMGVLAMCGAGYRRRRKSADE